MINFKDFNYKKRSSKMVKKIVLLGVMCLGMGVGKVSAGKKPKGSSDKSVMSNDNMKQGAAFQDLGNQVEACRVSGYALFAAQDAYNNAVNVRDGMGMKIESLNNAIAQAIETRNSYQKNSKEFIEAERNRLKFVDNRSALKLELDNANIDVKAKKDDVYMQRNNFDKAQVLLDLTLRYCVQYVGNKVQNLEMTLNNMNNDFNNKINAVMSQLANFMTNNAVNSTDKAGQDGGGVMPPMQPSEKTTPAAAPDVVSSTMPSSPDVIVGEVDSKDGTTTMTLSSESGVGKGNLPKSSNASNQPKLK